MPPVPNMVRIGAGIGARDDATGRHPETGVVVAANEIRLTVGGEAGVLSDDLCGPAPLALEAVADAVLLLVFAAEDEMTAEHIRVPPAIDEVITIAVVLIGDAVVGVRIRDRRDVLRRLMFTTPAIASEPYAADAPPVTISVRSMSRLGMRLRSAEPSRVVGAKRRPSSRISVRVTPRPRRFTICAPTLKLPKPFVLGLLLARKAGSSLSTWPMLVAPIFCSSSLPTPVTGDGASSLDRAMREPVMTTWAVRLLRRSRRWRGLRMSCARHA